MMTLKNSIKEFNAHLGQQESVIDKNFQHVADKILLHWGYEEFHPFMKKLLVSEKDRSRNGFPLEVMNELFELIEIHNRVYPDKAPK